VITTNGTNVVIGDTDTS